MTHPQFSQEWNAVVRCGLWGQKPRFAPQRCNSLPYVFVSQSLHLKKLMMPTAWGCWGSEVIRAESTGEGGIPWLAAVCPASVCTGIR